MATLNGNNYDNQMFGTSRADSIHALGGNDSVWAAAGNDKAWGGTGNDSVYGENGNDTIYGEAGNDNLLGGVGNDRLEGGTGDDRLDGGEDFDTLLGQAGHDDLRDSSGGAMIVAGDGDDLINCNNTAGNFTSIQTKIYGGAGSDHIYTRNGYADGGPDNDFVTSSIRPNEAGGMTDNYAQLHGGTGGDQFVIYGWHDGFSAVTDVLDFKPQEGDRLFLEQREPDGSWLDSKATFQLLDQNHDLHLDASDGASSFGSVYVTANEVDLKIEGDTTILHGVTNVADWMIV